MILLVWCQYIHGTPTLESEKSKLKTKMPFCSKELVNSHELRTNFWAVTGMGEDPSEGTVYSKVQINQK